MPDNACAAVAFVLCRYAGQPVGCRFFGHALLRVSGTNRGRDGAVDCVVLVIARHDLRQAATGFAEHGEVAQQIEEPLLLEQALDQRRKFRQAFFQNSLTIRSAPRHEAFQIGRQRPHARRDAVRRDQQSIGVKQCWNLLLVSLQLIERAGQMRARAARRFQFNHCQRQAVDEQHDVRPAVDLTVDDHELLHRQPVVAFRHIEVQKLNLARRQHAIVAVVFDICAFGQQRVNATVFFQQSGKDGLGELADGIRPRFRRKLRIEPQYDILQPLLQDDDIVTVAFRRAAVRADGVVRGNGVAKPAQLIEQGLLDGGFGQKGHQASPCSSCCSTMAAGTPRAAFRASM